MEIINYKCPNCSAPLTFNAASQNWGCKHCKAAFTKEQLSDLWVETGAKKAEAVAESDDLVSYSCPSCGGRILTEKNTAATFCCYCHAPTVIAAQLKDARRPEQIIPFQFKKEQAQEAITKLCKNRPFLPKNFREYGIRGEITGLYIPFWLYSLDADASLQAEATLVATWNDKHYMYTKTDTYRVIRSGSMHFDKIPADGSAKMDDALMESLEPFDYKMLTDFSTAYLSGFYAESYNVPAEDVRERIYLRANNAVGSMMRDTVGEYATVKVHSQHIDRKNVCYTQVMLPVWTLMAHFKGEKYLFAMNGQTGKMTGRLPLDWQRVGLWYAAIAAAVSIIAFIGGMVL